MFLGLRTIVYPAPDLAAAKAWFSQALGQPPYFDEPVYVGFEVGGYELGLHRDADPADAAFGSLIEQGATEHDVISEVGEGIRLGAVRTPAGQLVGIIENPHFKLP
jgi:catechol 2,3-dioxygenase-like lactoylglutathione lyase family enzyme